MGSITMVFSFIKVSTNSIMHTSSYRSGFFSLSPVGVHLSTSVWFLYHPCVIYPYHCVVFFLHLCVALHHSLWVDFLLPTLIVGLLNQIWNFPNPSPILNRLTHFIPILMRLLWEAIELILYGSGLSSLYSGLACHSRVLVWVLAKPTAGWIEVPFDLLRQQQVLLF